MRKLTFPFNRFCLILFWMIAQVLFLFVCQTSSRHLLTLPPHHCDCSVLWVPTLKMPWVGWWEQNLLILLFCGRKWLQMINFFNLSSLQNQSPNPTVTTQSFTLHQIERLRWFGHQRSVQWNHIIHVHWWHVSVWMSTIDLHTGGCTVTSHSIQNHQWHPSWFHCAQEWTILSQICNASQKTHESSFCCTISTDD